MLQTSAAGATVTYPPPAVVETGSGLASSSCAPLSGSVFPLGLTTVRCVATDVAGNTGSAAFTVTVNAVSGSLDGRMFGVGEIGDTGRHRHFVFRVSQVRNQDYGRLEYWRTTRGDVDWTTTSIAIRASRAITTLTSVMIIATHPITSKRRQLAASSSQTIRDFSRAAVLSQSSIQPVQWRRQMERSNRLCVRGRGNRPGRTGP